MRRPLGGWFAALSCLLACGTAPLPRVDPGSPPPPPTVDLTVPPAPPPLPCAGIGTIADRLGNPATPAPGNGIRSMDALTAPDGTPAQLVWTSELPGKPVDWVLRSGSGRSHVLWVLRRVEGGWCVLGSFVSPDGVNGPMTLPDRMLAGPSTAVALLRFESVPDERSKITGRYVALATDGERFWYALEGKGGHQLIAREAKLRTQGSAVFMDVPLQSKATAVLKFDGTRFIKLN